MITPTLLEQAAALGVTGEPFFVGDGFAKVFRMPADRVIGQHAHKTDHLGVLLLGTVGVSVEGTLTRYDAPAQLVLKAGVPHEIYSVTPALWACVWPDAHGAVTEEDFEGKVVA